jgi:PAS domain S-box-containing protein
MTILSPSIDTLLTENAQLRRRISELEQSDADQKLREREAALLAAQEMLELVINNLPMAIFWKDRDLRYLGCNRQFAQAAALDSPAEIIGRSDFDMPWREFAEQYRADDAAVMAADQPKLNFEEPIQESGKTVGWARTSKVPLHDDSGAVTTVLGIYEDITEYTRIQGELRRAHERMERAFEVSPLSTIEFGRDGRITRWNPSAERIFGWSAEEAIGKELLPLVVPDLAMEHVAAVRDALFEGKLTNSRNVNVTKDGRLITCQWYNTFMLDDDGTVTGVLCQTEDITEQQRVELERAALQEQVIEAQQAALRELSTPLIPVAAGIVVMPIIGSVDSGRAQQIMDTLLQGVAAQRAQVAIVDITGVKVVDTQVASALIAAAQAVRLLGAQVMLTGISPEVAETLVHLAADLRGLITRGDLQSGITYALSRQRGRAS